MRLPVRWMLVAALAALPLNAFAGTPITLDGIGNFYQVNERLYRGAQPEAHAWDDLAGLGVTTVLDLRRPGEHSTEGEKQAVEAAGMKYVNFPMNGFDMPTSEQMTRALSIIDANEKVFVHCKQGRDRTGTVVAAWRVARDNWTNKAALQEAHDCHINWFMGHMKRFIAGYQYDGPATATSPAMATVAPAQEAAGAQAVVPAAAAPATP